MNYAPFRLIGGVYPPEYKDISNQASIAELPIAPVLYISLQQSKGAPAEACVETGERVCANQLIARASKRLSVSVHAPASGVIENIAQMPSLHPSGLPETVIVLRTDPIQKDVLYTPLENWQTMPKEEVVDFLQQMGIAGLGGALFPSHLKVETSGVRRLILNGAECEPFLTCDDRLMREHAQEIIAGGKILAQLLNASEILIGIEDNKPEALAIFSKLVSQETDIPFKVLALKTKYPSGSSKQLTYLLTGNKLSSGTLSSTVGIQVFNVGTVFSIYEAIVKGQPLTRRVVTLTGDVARPGNVWGLIGTPIEHLMQYAQMEEKVNSVIVGGPMMGIEFSDLSLGINKGTNTLIAKSPDIFREPESASPCIRCGNCAAACPQLLQPMDLYWLSQSKDYEKAKQFGIFDCIECASCDYVCPSHIPIVDYIKHAKSQLRRISREALAAEQAKRRSEFREFRLERDKTEKAERLAKMNTKAKEALAQKTQTDSAAQAKETSLAPDEEKKAAIAAAMVRVAAKKNEPVKTESGVNEIVLESQTSSETSGSQGVDGSHQAETTFKGNENEESIPQRPVEGESNNHQELKK